MTIQLRTLTRTAIAGLALAALPMGAIAAPTGPGTIKLVSAAPGGGGGAGDSTAGTEKGLDASADGRYVVFSSYASDLVANDTNNQRDVFVRDTRTGRTTLASVGVDRRTGQRREPGGVDLGGRPVRRLQLAMPRISSPVTPTTARTSSSATCAPGGRPWSRWAPTAWPTTARISRRSRPTASTWSSPRARRTWWPATPTSTEDIFVRDLVTRRTERISLGASGEQLDIYSREPAISGNGRFVAYVTAARTVSVYDRLKKTTRVISDGVTLDPSTTFHEIGYTTFSADGRFVLFEVTEYEMLGGDEVHNFWLRDLRTGKLELITADSNGKPSRVTGLTRQGGVSSDGRYVTVGTTARLTPADTDDVSDVYRLDRKTGSRVRITKGQRPNQYDQVGSTGPAISGDGRHVAFQSVSDGLVPHLTTSQQVYQWSS